MTQNPDGFGWSERLALSVAQEVRRHRQRQKLSAKQLADRCAALGMPIQRSVLANLESGRRATITVAEVMVLAAALGVAPGHLIFPVGYEEDIELLPDQYAPPFGALEWFSGERQLTGGRTPTEESPIAAYVWHRHNIERLQMALLRRDAGVRRYLEAVESHDELAARLKRIQAEMEPLDQQVAGHMESLRGVPLSERPPRPESVTEARARLRDLRTEERDIRRQLDAEQWMKDSVHSYDAEVADVAGTISRFRKMMRDKGWLPPAVPEKLVPYVDAPTLDVLETFHRHRSVEPEDG